MYKSINIFCKIYTVSAQYLHKIDALEHYNCLPEDGEYKLINDNVVVSSFLLFARENIESNVTNDVYDRSIG